MKQFFFITNLCLQLNLTSRHFRLLLSLIACVTVLHCVFNEFNDNLRAEDAHKSTVAAWQLPPEPNPGSREELKNYLLKLKTIQPTTPDQYRAMQTAIKNAAQKLLPLCTDKNTEEYKAVEMDYYSSSVMLLGNDGPESQIKTFNQFRDHLQSKKSLETKDLQMALLAGQNMEQFADKKPAQQAYQALVKLLEEKKDPTLDIWIEMMKANAKRVGMLGNEFRIEAKTLSGEPFDTKSLRGKYTLVYFWATWNKSCEEEYPYMRMIYQKYRDKGFEIVAFSLDEDKEKLLQHVREKETPWIQLWEEAGKNAPKVVREYGISAIPSLILLDKEGRVLSLEARGLILGKLLQDLLDPVPAPSPTAGTATAGTATTSPKTSATPMKLPPATPSITKQPSKKP